jgi:uncharacterized protein
MNTQFISEQGNGYWYSPKLKSFLYLPEDLSLCVSRQSGQKRDDYYERKYKFLAEHHCFDDHRTEFQPEYDPEMVRQNLANLRQLLIEVTDDCNLKCRYCGYGEFYSNYDQRCTHNQTFDNVKLLIDALVAYWRGPYNLSHNKAVFIGFYGGEPLMNMPLIKETIAYVEQLDIPEFTYSYNMTTNSMLLDRYMDYLAEKEFDLLLSLDGDEWGSSYRVDHGGHGSFSRVVANIHRLKDKYPEYFESHVSFNSVLHDRNSTQRTFDFIHKEFGKTPRIAELSTNGIIPEREGEFAQMFKDKFVDFRQNPHSDEIEEEYKVNNPEGIQYHSMMMQYCGNRYDTYTDLFDETATRYVPTGTCPPFERKLFLTVNGKILPCEKVGQQRVIASVKDGVLDLDPEKVARLYSEMYKQVLGSCSHCALGEHCGQCMFLLQEKNHRLSCPHVVSRAMQQRKLVKFVSYAEEHPNEYEELMSEISID